MKKFLGVVFIIAFIFCVIYGDYLLFVTIKNLYNTELMNITLGNIIELFAGIYSVALTLKIILIIIGGEDYERS